MEPGKAIRSSKLIKLHRESKENRFQDFRVQIEEQCLETLDLLKPETSTSTDIKVYF